MRLRSSFQHSKIPVPLHKVSYSANNMQRTKPPSMGGLLHAVPRVACLLTSHARPHRSASCVHAQQHLSADVAIVGAGPGGLAAAHAIAAAAPQLQIAVFERSRASLQSSKRGAGLGLDVNGQKALQAINPELLARVLDQACALRTARVMKHDGTLVGEVPYAAGAREKYVTQGYPAPCMLGWSELQQLLVMTLPGSVTVHTGTEFDRFVIADTGGQITTYFKALGCPQSQPEQMQPTSSSRAECTASAAAPIVAAIAAGTAKCRPTSAQQEQQQQEPQGQQQPQAMAVTSQLLVASDGYFSRVRRQCLDDGPPEWGGSLVYRARLPAESAAQAGLGPWLTDSSVVLKDEGRYFFAYPISSGDVVWTVGATDEKLLELGLDPQTTRQQLHPASNTTTTTTSSSSSSSTPSGDITDQQTPGYSSQETAAGTAAKVRCLQVLSGFWDAAVQVVQTTPAQSLVEHGIYTRPASKMDPDCFGKGRVVVIGDAAHPMRPWGQSVSQALEDAWALGRAVQECVSVSDSSSGGDSQLSSEVLQALLPRLQAFRVQRAERLRPVVAFTTESGKAAYDAVKGEGSQQAAAEASVRGPDGDSMTADVFTEFCCDVEFERLHAG